VFFAGAVSAVVIYGAWKALDYIHVQVGLGAFGHAFVLGAATFGRVVILLIVASVIWVPVGVWIGMNPRRPGRPGRAKDGELILTAAAAPVGPP
jgi:NitT/TauT family transport system permease protein